MTDKPGRNHSGVSRRDFLRGTGASVATASLVSLPTTSESAPVKTNKTKQMGPDPISLTLNVNGMELSTKVEPRVTLLDALRNYLDVTGCKRVCDRGSCGACTVLLDGKTVYACSMLALEAQGKKIQTAESLISGEKLEKVPAAFVANDAQQCGFCTPGFVVSMHAAFQENPNAKPEEIEEALSGNICRCGTYQQMKDAIADLCQNKKED